MYTTGLAAKVRPGPVFFGLCALTAFFGVLLWRGDDFNGVALFGFVIAGWVLSLTLHEFGHAIVAYLGGDTSVASKGYLNLDVRRYADPGTSLLMPVIFLLLGGIGLPGGAVWINTGAIASKQMRSMMSAAGPAANIICAAVCLIPLRIGLVGFEERPWLAAGVAFLGSLQVIAVLFNLVPIPGFDGFGIIEPHLSREALVSLAPVRQYGIWIFLAALWFVPSVSEGFWSAVDGISGRLGGGDVELLRALGWNEFRFWER